MSPDKKRMVYSKSAKPSVSGLYMYDFASRKTKTVLPGSEHAGRTSWSADSNMLVYSTTEGLFIMKPDGTERKQILARTGDQWHGIENPGFNSTGETILFHDKNTLYEVDKAGNIKTEKSIPSITGRKDSVSGDYKLTTNPANQNLIAYSQAIKGSPEFEKRHKGPSSAVFIYNVTTKIRKRVNPVNLYSRDPIWSADGKYLFFTGSPDKTDVLYIYKSNCEGKKLTKIGIGEYIGI